MSWRYNAKTAYEQVMTDAVREASQRATRPITAADVAIIRRVHEEEAEAAAEQARSQQRVWRALVKEVMAGFPECHYCGEEATSVDHLMPFSRGGQDVRENLVPACSSCNWEKLDFTVEEWMDYRAEKGLCWPPEGRQATLLRIVTEALAGAR